ncbi:MAG: hypothetical protein B7Z80_07875 [Rhodospirillales bacterium 20-64-7]|nr:MAG: hypothetical protein B7Z80_07875 [Rhodospirillales bacterium 20-64-7]
MADQKSEQKTDPFEVFNFSKSMLAAQQKLMPSMHGYERLAEAARLLTQAQIAYGQAVMRANSVLLGAVLAPVEAQADYQQRPSVAARQPELAA